VELGGNPRSSRRPSIPESSPPSNLNQPVPTQFPRTSGALWRRSAWLPLGYQALTTDAMRSRSSTPVNHRVQCSLPSAPSFTPSCSLYAHGQLCPCLHSFCSTALPSSSSSLPPPLAELPTAASHVSITQSSTVSARTCFTIPRESFVHHRPDITCFSPNELTDGFFLPVSDLFLCSSCLHLVTTWVGIVILAILTDVQVLLPTSSSCCCHSPPLRGPSLLFRSHGKFSLNRGAHLFRSCVSSLLTVRFTGGCHHCCFETLSTVECGTLNP
jgi:hypothetical protein